MEARSLTPEEAAGLAIADAVRTVLVLASARTAVRDGAKSLYPTEVNG